MLDIVFVWIQYSFLSFIYHPFWLCACVFPLFPFYSNNSIVFFDVIYLFSLLLYRCSSPVSFRLKSLLFSSLFFRFEAKKRNFSFLRHFSVNDCVPTAAFSYSIIRNGYFIRFVFHLWYQFKEYMLCTCVGFVLTLCLF